MSARAKHRRGPIARGRNALKVAVIDRVVRGAPPIEERGLHERTGNLVEVRGLFRPRLYVDPLLQAAPAYLKTFLLYHESTHAVMYHPLWLALYRLASLGFASPWARQLMETQADTVALAVCGPRDFANAVQHLYKPPTSRLQRWFHDIHYGRSFVERCERVGCRFVNANTGAPAPREEVLEAVGGESA